MAEDQVPVLIAGPLALCDALRGGQIEHPVGEITAGKAGLVFHNLPGVQALNDVGRVYDFPILFSLSLDFLPLRFRAPGSSVTLIGSRPSHTITVS